METQQDRTTSSPIGKIAEALSKAQSKFVQPSKNKTVTVRPKTSAPYSFEYADYNAIVEAVRGPLSEHGLCFSHLVEIRNEKLMLVTKLIHSSGEVLESLWPLAGSSDPKEFGGDMTYGKRYSLSAITGCVADDDTDAPGEIPEKFEDRKPNHAPSNRASIATAFEELDLPDPVRAAQKAPKVSISSAATPQPKGEAIKPPVAPNPAALTGPQFTRLWAVATAQHWQNSEVHDYMLRAYGITSAKALTLEQYNSLISHIETFPPNRKQD